MQIMTLDKGCSEILTSVAEGVKDSSKRKTRIFDSSRAKDREAKVRAEQR